jgi:hypothetical protein
MPDTIVVIDCSGSMAPAEIRPATPDEQAQIDASRANPPIVYHQLSAINARTTTTDDQPHEVYRFPTSAKHVYRATIRVTGIDAGNGTTRDSEVRMVFKGLAASVVQVGSSAVLSNMQDTGAASWRIAAAVDGADLVFSVTGAVGRTIDWLMTGELGAFVPEGTPV